MATLNDSTGWMKPSICSRRRVRLPEVERRRAAIRARRVVAPKRRALAGFDCAGTLRMTVVAAAIVAGMAGCAQAPTTPDAASEVRVQPVYRLAHSDSAQVAGLAAPTVMRQGDVDRKATSSTTAVPLNAAELQARAAQGDPEALHTLGVQLAQQGKLTEGIAALRLADAKAPGQPRVLNNLGYALQLHGQPEQARSMYEAALLADPAYDRARTNLTKLVGQTAAPAAVPSVQPLVVAPAVVASEAPRTVLTLSAEPAAVAAQPAHAAVLAMQAVQTAEALEVVAVSAASLPEAESHVFDVAADGDGMAELDFVAPGAGVAVRPLAPATNAAPSAAVASNAKAGMSLIAAAVEVLNGNGMAGAGGALRTWLAERGVRVARVGNAALFNHEMTRVEYQPGHVAAARQVSRRLPLSSELVEVAARSQPTPVRVVLGHDLRMSMALQSLADQRSAHPALKAAANGLQLSPLPGAAPAVRLDIDLAAL